MITILKPNATKQQIENLIIWFKNQNLDVHVSEGEYQTVLGLIGDTSRFDSDFIGSLDIVDKVQRVSEPFKNANRKFHPEDSVVSVGDVLIGGGNFAFIAGPCSIESADSINEIASMVKASGANILRGGAFNQRTSPYSFQGMGSNAINLLAEAKKATKMPVVSEIINLNHLDLYEDVDLLMVGSRNMQNFELLRELGKINKPVLLKRGLSNTMQELLMSAEYIMAGGNENIILCESGIRTFENYTKSTLDISAVPKLKEVSHLPVVVDPSQATGQRKLVKKMALAAAAAGADGLLIEVHNDPEHALCDGPQSLTPVEFKSLVEDCNKILNVLN